MISDAEGLTNPRSGISKRSASFVAGLTSFVTPFPARRVLAIAFVVESSHIRSIYHGGWHKVAVFRLALPSGHSEQRFLLKIGRWIRQSLDHRSNNR